MSTSETDVFDETWKSYITIGTTTPLKLYGISIIQYIALCPFKVFPSPLPQATIDVMVVSTD